MGEKINAVGGIFGRKSGGSSDGGNGKSQPSSADSSPATGAGAGAGAGAGTAEKKEKPAVKNLVEERKKKMQRTPVPQGKPEKVPRIEKVEDVRKVSEPKPKQQRKSKKKTAIKPEDLDAIFMPLVGFVSSRPDMEHWAMSEKEIRTVTEPLADVLSKFEALKALENSAEIALVIAVVALVAPRTAITVKKRKEKKNGKEVSTSASQKLDGNRKSTVVPGRDSKTSTQRGKNIETERSGGNVQRQNANDGKTAFDQLSTLPIPAVG